MKLTRFVRLRNAIAQLDVRYVARKIHELRDFLGGDGIELEPENTVITEDAIFYIHPYSGMTTKVALYQPDQYRKLPDKGRLSKRELSLESPETFHRYHIMRCNFLSHDERAGWKTKYRAVQRLDDAFHCQIVTDNPASKSRSSRRSGYIGDNGQQLTTLYELKNQQLYPCDHCLTKINSLLEASQVYQPENFNLSIFLQSGFESTWMRKGNYSKEYGAFAEMYPTDYEAIVETRLRQCAYTCEVCNFDMSEPHLRAYAHIHTEDYLSSGVSYIHIRSMCLGCRAEQPDGMAYAELPEYESFQKLYANHEHS